MKISVITVTLNAGCFLEECITSVHAQSYHDVEYILVDGFSSDHTREIIRQHQEKITHFISEKDDNLYDAINKGINMSTGAIIGVLNADDYYPSPEILTKIAETFERTGADVVYGNLDYVNRKDTSKVIRKWRTSPYEPGRLNIGWMPAHPTFYVKRELLERYGTYRLRYGSSADYELMIRFLYKYKVKAAYLDALVVKMRTGGISNVSFRNRCLASYHDFLAMRDNGLPLRHLAILLKPLLKIPQFIRLTN